MASDYQSKQSPLMATFKDCDSVAYRGITTEPAKVYYDALTRDRAQSAGAQDVGSFSTLSLVDTIQNNLQRRQSTGIIAEMGSSASKDHTTSKLDELNHISLDPEPRPGSAHEISLDSEPRPGSVEVCGDPALEEAEGISHAQIVTQINSDFDAGCNSYNSDASELSVNVSFASILDEFKPPANPAFRGKSQKTQRDKNPTRASSSPKLNLTLTGMKAKQINRNSQSANSTPRVVSSRDRFQRQRNPNVMKSLEERMSSAQRNGGKKRPDWNQNTTFSHDRNGNRQAKPVRKPCRRVNILAAIKPSNVEDEKKRFFASNFSVNPLFEYRYPANEAALARYNNASTLYLEEATAILHRVLKRYGNYEKFEAATGGRVLSKTEIWNTVKRYLEREGFLGEVVVDISNDLLSRAAMTINGGRPTLSIRESSAREFWVEGLLRHEIGTHHLRFHNNRQQSWFNLNVRRQLELQPANPTEEGLASLHSVLMRKDPSLWRAAMLYYTAHKASQLSFVELFKDLGQFIDSPDVRWDYCLRTKRGQTDTSKPGCFCKDQVYLTGILALLQRRKTLDFHMLCVLGKVSHEDIDRLRGRHTMEGTKIPSFMKDIDEYRRRLDYIVHMNGLERFLDPHVDKEKDEDV